MKNANFSDVEIKGHFVCNGTHWEKRSSRTAALLEQPSRWFYFSDTDRVQVAENSLTSKQKRK